MHLSYQLLYQQISAVITINKADMSYRNGFKRIRIFEFKSSASVLALFPRVHRPVIGKIYSTDELVAGIARIFFAT